MFVVDLLHEVELGAAKGVITQLIRIMYSLGGDTITIFNERYVIIHYFDLNGVKTSTTGSAMFLHLVVIPYENFMKMYPL
jgi:hypothetical protein